MSDEKERLEQERDELLRELEQAEGVTAFNALAASFLQALLQQAGYKVRVDGILDARTVAALQKFLRAEGWKNVRVTGAFDLVTTNALTQWSTMLVEVWKRRTGPSEM